MLSNHHFMFYVLGEYQQNQVPLEITLKNCRGVKSFIKQFYWLTLKTETFAQVIYFKFRIFVGNVFVDLIV